MGDFVEVTRRKSKKTPKPMEKTSPWSEEEFGKHYLKMVKCYKTEKCKDGYGRNFPFCPQGKQCFFAHSELELRRDPLIVSYGRGICQAKGDCASGRECQYAHNDCETMYHPRTYKTKPCKHGSKCERGVYCAFQHEDDILTQHLRMELFQGHNTSDNNSHYQPSESYDDELLEVEEIPKPQEVPDLQKRISEVKLDNQSPSRQEPAPQQHQQPQKVPVPQIIQPPALVNPVETQPRTASMPSSPQMLPSPKLAEHRLKSTAIVLQMLTRVSQEQAEALLDILSATEEGRYGVDLQKNTALIHAVSKGFYRLIPALANGRTVDTPNAHQQTPLSIAIDGDDKAMLAELMKCGVNLNVGQGALLHAIKKNCMGCAYLIVSSPLNNLSLCDSSGNTALILSAAKGLESFIQTMFRFMPSSMINHRNSRGETALFTAARHDAVNALVLLLRHGVADPNIPDESGTSPLMIAIEFGPRCAEILLQVPSVDPNARDFNNNTALTVATRRGATEITRKLYERGVQPVSFPPAFSNAGSSFMNPGQDYFPGLSALPGGPGMPLTQPGMPLTQPSSSFPTNSFSMQYAGTNNNNQLQTPRESNNFYF